MSLRTWFQTFFILQTPIHSFLHCQELSTSRLCLTQGTEKCCGDLVTKACNSSPEGVHTFVRSGRVGTGLHLVWVSDGHEVREPFASGKVHTTICTARETICLNNSNGKHLCTNANISTNYTYFLFLSEMLSRSVVQIRTNIMSRTNFGGGGAVVVS